MGRGHSVGRAHPRRPIPAERKRKQSRVGELVGSAPCVGMASCSLLSGVKAPGNHGGQNDQGTPVWSELMNERQGTAHSRARLCDLGRGGPPRRTSRGALAASGTRNRASAEVSGGTSRRGTRAAYPYGEAFNYPHLGSGIASFAPRAMSVSRERPRQMTVFPGGGSRVRAR